MKRWGLLLIVIGIGSFVLPAIGMQFRLINLAGGDPSTSGVLFIVAGAVLYLIGQAVEGRARPTLRPQGAPPAQAAAPGRPVQAPPPAAPTAGPTFCGNCGTRLTRPVKFCTACGAPIQ
jgi:hypothetical protein